MGLLFLYSCNGKEMSVMNLTEEELRMLALYRNERFRALILAYLEKLEASPVSPDLDSENAQ